MLGLNNLRASILSNYVSGNAATVVSHVAKTFLKDAPSYQEKISCGCKQICSFPVLTVSQLFKNDFSNLNTAIEENLIQIVKCSECKLIKTFERSFNQHVMIEVSLIDFRHRIDSPTYITQLHFFKTNFPFLKNDSLYVLDTLDSHQSKTRQLFWRARCTSFTRLAAPNLFGWKRVYPTLRSSFSAATAQC